MIRRTLLKTLLLGAAASMAVHVSALSVTRWVDNPKFGTGLAISPDGKLLVGGGGAWELPSGFPCASAGAFPFGIAFRWTRFEPNGRSFLSSCADSFYVNSPMTSTTFDASTLLGFGPQIYILDAAYARNGASVYGCGPGWIYEFAPKTFLPIRSVQIADNSHYLDQLRLSPRDEMLATVDGNGEVFLVSTLDMAVLRTMTEAQGGFLGIQFSPDGSKLYGVSDKGDVYRWNLDDGSPATVIANVGHPSNVQPPDYWQPPLAVSPSGEKIATVGGEGVVTLLDKEGNILATRPTLLTGYYCDVLFGDDDHLYVSDRNGVAVLLASDLTTERWFNQLQSCLSVDWSPIRPELVTTRPYAVSIRDAQNGTILKTLREGAGYTRARYSHSGNLVAIGGTSVELVDPITNQSLVLDTGGAASNDLRFARNDAYLASAGSDGSVRLWKLDGALVKVLRNAAGSATSSVDFNPNGLTMAVAYANSTVEVYRLSDFKRIATLSLDAAPTWIRYTSNAKSLVVAYGPSLGVFTAGTWVRTKLMKLSGGYAYQDFTLTPDNLRALANIRYGSTIYVPLVDGLPALTPDFYSAQGYAAFSPRGDAMAVAGGFWGNVVGIYRNPLKLGLGSLSIPVFEATEGAWMATVHLTGPAPDGGAMVTIRSDSTNVKVPQSLYIPAGETLGTFPVAVKPVSVPADAVVGVSYSQATVTHSIVLLPPYLSALTTPAQSLQAGKSATLTAKLDAHAPVGGTTLNLSSDSPYLAVPTTVIVPAGRLSFPVQVTASAPPAATSATVTATQQVPLRGGRILTIRKDVRILVKPS